MVLKIRATQKRLMNLRYDNFLIVFFNLVMYVRGAKLIHKGIYKAGNPGQSWICILFTAGQKFREGGTCPAGLESGNMPCRVREGGAFFGEVGWVRLAMIRRTVIRPTGSRQINY